jgi:subtilase family serine protease
MCTDDCRKSRNTTGADAARLGTSIGRAACAAALAVAFGAGTGVAAPLVLVKGMVRTGGAKPPTYAQCVAATGSPCYSPQDMRTAYGLNGLLNGGFVGTGQTIILIEAYGSPTIEHDLRAFDKGYGIPDPPKFEVRAPLGTVPYNPTLYPDQPGGAFETTLDVEGAHAMAPGAAIIVMTSPVDETEGVQGLPEFLSLEQIAVEQGLGNVISQSWSATENTLFLNAAGPRGPTVVAAYDKLYAKAVLKHITVLASAGDDGSSNPTLQGPFYPFPTVGFPASSPLVTAVGGTNLTLDSSGNYISEQVWNDPGCCAGGGGISQLYQEPVYQLTSLPEATQSMLGGMRGVPDISYNAEVYYESILVYASFPGLPAGYYGVGGTSEGSPQWAGIVADLNQYAGRPLGFLNPAIYAAGGLGLLSEIGQDITVGNNALQGVTGAAPGYDAGPGWDPASGWGTPNLSNLPLSPWVLPVAWR